MSHSAFLSGKNVLITGRTGFVGQHLFEALQKYNLNIYSISKRFISKDIHTIDILDFKSLYTFIKRKKIHTIFHLAGQSKVETGQTDPFQTFSVNIQGTLNILEAARLNGVEKMIIASSSHVYGKNVVPYLEDFAPLPSRPYETSKACTDLIAQSYADTFNLPVLIPRFVNIYGPGDRNFNRIVPHVIKHILTRKKIKIWGGTTLRDYLFIEDAVEAFLKMATYKGKMKGKNRIFNFGSGNIVTVSQLVRKIVAVSGFPAQIERISIKRKHEINKSYVSYEKAVAILKWHPKHSLDQGLVKSLNWYKNYFNENIDR